MEDIISLKKYGFNALANMMIFAKYLNFGGGVIIRRHDNDDYEMEYYSNETLVTNTPEDLTTTPDVNTSLMIVYSWLESVSITEIGFYIDEAYKMFMTDSEEERFMYRKRMYYKTKEYTLYKTVKGANNTTLSDTNVEQGRGYFYKVRAYYTDWGRMYYGEFSPALQTTAGLCNPGVKKITSQLWRCSLVWNENKYAEGYDLYCSSTSSSSGFKYIGTTSNTFWNTVRMTSGKRYYLCLTNMSVMFELQAPGLLQI